MELPSYFLDKFEVTNRQFKDFVDAGGYREAKYWRYTFRRQGRDAPFEEAMPLLRDATGRPGPSGWELGAFPRNQGDFPVSGVSWYEAAAYCESRGKSLPTVHHWRKAAGMGIFAEILRFSNFAGAGPARVGANTGISALGAYDMAGNVKEWCWNPAGERRAILGGGWNEPRYMYTDEDAQDPLARAPAYGFRCALYPEQVPAAAFAPVSRPVRDYATEKPVSNDVFEVFRRLYAYDKTPLDAKTESADESSEYFRKERVSYSAAYAGERIPAILYLPRNARPPYQAVIWAPGGYAFGMRSIENAPTEYFKFLLRAGRAVLYPVYKGTFERRIEGAAGPNADARENGTVREGCVPLRGFSGEPPGYSEGRRGVLRPEFGGDVGNSDTRAGAPFQSGHSDRRWNGGGQRYSRGGPPELCASRSCAHADAERTLRFCLPAWHIATTAVPLARHT